MSRLVCKFWDYATKGTLFHCTVYLVFGIFTCYLYKRPLVPPGKDWRKASNKTHWYFIKVLPWGNLVFPAFKGFAVCKLTQDWKLVHGPRVFFFLPQFKGAFSSFVLENFHLNRLFFKKMK